MKRCLILIVLLPVVLYLIFQLPVNLKANTIIVPDDYSTIQGAIDASRHGDTIIVEPGRYIEGINFRGKRITVASRFYTEQDTSYISRTIIDGNNQVPNVVLFENNETSSSRLIGFTITGGNAVDTEPYILYENGGGINVLSSSTSSPPLVSYCIIRNNIAKSGGGVFYSHPIKIENSRIFDNTATEYGGGIGSGTPYFGEIINCEIYSNTASGGGGIYLLGGSHLVKDSYIHDNVASANDGGGLLLVFCTVTVKNTTVVNNQAVNGGGLCLSGPSTGMDNITKKTYIVNSTISNNRSQSLGSSIYIKRGAIGYLVNSISYNNHLDEIAFSQEEGVNTLIVAYSNIKGGKEGIELNDNGELEWLEGNIDADPLFVDAENNDYRLGENSPCIDSGTSSFIYDGNTIVDLDESDYFGDAPDMGAFQWWGTSTGQNELPLPQGNRLELYPNPFNPATTIKFSLQKAGDVILSIYNIRGQRVHKLVESFLDKGEHYYAWNGKDGEENPVSSGVYLVKLEQGSDVAVTKTALMK